MSEIEEDGEWVEQDSYDGYEVNRQGDRVFLSFSAVDGTVQRFDLDPEDAVDLGIALAQAGQAPEESK